MGTLLLLPKKIMAYHTKGTKKSTTKKSSKGTKKGY